MSDIIKKIGGVFSPSTAVKSEEHLLGREDELARVLETLATPGRSVFIYGDRGVGKTSLALTAAYKFNSAKTDPVVVSAHGDATFARLLGTVCRRLLAIPLIRNGTKKKRTFQASAHALKYISSIEKGESNLPESMDINDIIEVLEEISSRLPDSDRRVVVVDEFEELERDETKKQFAQLLKQLGDHEIRVKFVVCGIAQDVSDLIHHHESASRYMATVRLGRLPFDVLRDLLLSGFSKLEVSCAEMYALRTAVIADGFASYTHLLGFKMAHAVLQQGAVGQSVFSHHYELAVKNSVRESEGWLQDRYSKAVQKAEGNRYEPVLWAVADHWETVRSTKDLYDSYKHVCRQLKSPPEDQKAFYRLLVNLKKAGHGEAVIPKSRGHYKMRIAMMRGYCRLRAQEAGVEIGIDYLKDRKATSLRLQKE